MEWLLSACIPVGAVVGYALGRRSTQARLRELDVRRQELEEVISHGKDERAGLSSSVQSLLQVCHASGSAVAPEREPRALVNRLAKEFRGLPFVDFVFAADASGLSLTREVGPSSMFAALVPNLILLSEHVRASFGSLLRVDVSSHTGRSLTALQLVPGTGHGWFGVVSTGADLPTSTLRSATALLSLSTRPWAPERVSKRMTFTATEVTGTFQSMTRELDETLLREGGDLLLVPSFSETVSATLASRKGPSKQAATDLWEQAMTFAMYASRAFDDDAVARCVLTFPDFLVQVHTSRRGTGLMFIGTEALNDLAVERIIGQVEAQAARNRSKATA
jgi:hypothetical protein